MAGLAFGRTNEDEIVVVDPSLSFVRSRLHTFVANYEVVVRTIRTVRKTFLVADLVRCALVAGVVRLAICSTLAFTFLGRPRPRFG